MTTPVDRKLWYLPRWFHYAVSVLLALVFLYGRVLLSPIMGSKSPFGLAIVPVAAAAYIGGFAPGMLTALLGLVGSTFLFTEMGTSGKPLEASDVFQYGIIVSLCIFICYVTGRLRRSAMRNSRLVDELDAEGKQTREVLESITDSFFAVDKNWIVTQTNSHFDQLTASKGFPSILGQSLWEVFPGREDNPVYKALHEAMERSVPRRLDAQDPSGSSWYQLRIHPNPKGLSVFLHDVTDRIMIEQSRERMLAEERRARSAAEEASRMKEEFLATLSHELRTPMTSLLGWAEMLNKGGSTEERLKEGLNSIEQSARNQAKLVEELLDVSRINAGKLKIELEFCVLSDLVEEAVLIHKPAAVAKRIELIYAEESDGAVIRGDSARLHQVFSNLISNAIKFTPKGGQVRVRVYQEESTSCFSVEDTGEGITPEFLPHVFDRFRQADASTTRRYGGLGLGLAIVKQLVELQGGTITAESEGAGLGSRFEVCLPTSAFDQRFSSIHRKSEQVMGLKDVRVLIVEDDDSTRRLLQRLVEDQESTVVVASSGVEALKIIPGFDPNIVLSDVGMPEMDGYALAAAIRELPDPYCRLPIIALTAFARDTDRKMAKESGFSAFLTKPVNPGTLIHTILDLLRT